MNYKILVAEDDPDIVALLRLYLESSGFEVFSAENGEDALKVLEKTSIDLAVLDIMMPKMDGYELTKQIRQSSNIPIIILSAKSKDNDKILGLNIGADAYMTKPFNPMEIVAQIQANLRRFYQLGGTVSQQSDSNFLILGDLCLDMDRFVLTKKQEVIFLTPTELKILTKLMKSPERVYTKAQLYECINGEFFDNDDNTMMVHISNLREKIEEDPKNPKYIKTIRGLGYKIENS